MNRKQTVFAVFVTTLFVLAIGVTWVVAQSDGVIRACVNPSGQPRIVEDSVSCLPKETLLEWNIQGEKGDKGDQGDVGPVGPEGPQGPAGPPLLGMPSPDIDSGWVPCDSTNYTLDMESDNIFVDEHFRWDEAQIHNAAYQRSLSDGYGYWFYYIPTKSFFYTCFAGESYEYRVRVWFIDQPE